MPQVVNTMERTWDGEGLPQRSNCDMTVARQRFLWMFTGFLVKGAPLPLPTEFFEAASEHICECLGLDTEIIDGVKRLMVVTAAGERVPGDPLPDAPHRKYQAAGNMLNRMTAAGQWVDFGDPDLPLPDTKQLFEGLPQHERAEVASVVLESFGLSTEEPQQQVQVRTVAKNVGLKPAQVIEVAAVFGARGLKAGSLIDRRLADRIIRRIQGE